MKRLLILIVLVGIALSLPGGGVWALSYCMPGGFRDTETSTGNTFAAGTWSIDHIVINEVMYDPLQDDSKNEWIELYNPNPWPIDVGGWQWRIIDNNTPQGDRIGGDRLHGDGTTVIPAHGYAVITDMDTLVYVNFYIPQGAVKLCVEDCAIGNGLNNGGDNLTLQDPNGAPVDAIEWGVESHDLPGQFAERVAEGHSLARYPEQDTDNSAADFYADPTPTPGARNS
jgi:hypothetical protein